MGYDLVTWAPRVGASGDDAYNIPGGTKLNASVDSGNPTRIEAGGSTFTSPVPTIAEINASSQWNQVIGLYNRRQSQMNTILNGTPTPISYISPDTRITAATIAALYTAIGSLRTSEGFGAYTFPTAEIAANKIVYGYHLAHARKALAISGVQTKTLKKWARDRLESPYGTVNAARSSIYTGSTPVSNYGPRAPFQGGPNDLSFDGLANGYRRVRYIGTFPVFGFTDSAQIVTATLKLVASTSGTTTGYLGPTGTTSVDNAAAPIAADFDTLTSQVNITGTGTFTLALSASLFASTQLMQHFLWAVSTDYLANSAGLVGTAEHSPGSLTHTLTLEIDWG